MALLDSLFLLLSHRLHLALFLLFLLLTLLLLFALLALFDLTLFLDLVDFYEGDRLLVKLFPPINELRPDDLPLDLFPGGS
jgi:hypothetical protein